ncbi:MAG: class I SAM-dependent methyltransferase [Ktedonobacterales bacterium]
MNNLEEVIGQEIAHEGPITFARFMELALYHPTLGYYSGGGEGREPLGWSGDYFTSGDVHPLWGWAIARQLHQMWQLLGSPERFDVVEPGAGRGLLARDVWHFALQRAPEWAEALVYTLIDRAASGSPLRRRRQERLNTELQRLNVPDDAVRVVDTLSDVRQRFTGCVVSNEVVDALPVHILEKQEEGLAEVYVSLDPEHGQLIEQVGGLSSPEMAGYLDQYDIPWRDYPNQWRCEVCLDAGRWLREVANHLERGYLLTIDYGSMASELYTPQRLRGTLAIYRQHQLRERPLAQPGRQDITAHVNFSALTVSGRAIGIDTIGITSQGKFLGRLGIREEAQMQASLLYPYAESERHTDRGQTDYLRRATILAAVSTLLDPHGLGAFQVLAQQRGVPESGRNLLGLA